MNKVQKCSKELHAAMSSSSPIKPTSSCMMDSVVGNCCMMCGKATTDAEDYSQWYSEGIYWVYCRACDCWTEHPVPAELRDISNAPRESRAIARTSPRGCSTGGNA